MNISRRTLMVTAALAAVLVYANSLANHFAYDDIWIIVRNARVHQLHDWRSILFTPYWPSFGSELGLYRPLTILAFAFEWVIGGGAPWVFHLMNLLLHTAATLLVFILIERLATTRAAAAGAILFAVHPLHTEAVANVVGQGELWAAIAVLTACIIYVKRPDGIEIDWRTRAVLFALYALGLLFKESAVVLPGLLVLLDFAQRRVRYDASLRAYVRAMAFPLAVFTIILLAFLTLRISILGNLTGTDAAPGLPYLREHFRVLNALRAWPEYVRLLFFPLDLSVDYAPGVILPVESITPMVALGFVLVAATVVFTFATPRRPLTGVIAGWFLITILPVSNFFFPIGVLIAERTLYLPSLAVCLFAGVALDQALAHPARETRRLALAFAFVVALGFGLRTVIRNPDWDTLGTVWQGLSRDHPESYRAQWLNGINLWSQGKPDIAEKYFQLAERIWPRDSQLLSEIGNFYIGRRNYPKAISYLERSRAMTAFVPRTHEFLADAYLNAGRPQDALNSAIHAGGMAGNDRALTFATIAAAYDKLHRFDDAAGAWRATTRAENGDLWLNWAKLARSLASGGRKEEALRAADIAYNRTNRQPALQKVVNDFKQSIVSNCYPAGGSCDVLQGWATVDVAPPASGK